MMKTIVSNSRRLSFALLFIVTCGALCDVHAQGARRRSELPPRPPATAAQITPLPARAVADKLAPANWTRYEIGQPARFSLFLPAAPETSGERMEVSPGLAVTVRNYMTVNDTGVYGATYVDDLPAKPGTWTEANKKTFFDSFAKGFAEGFQAGLKDTTREQIQMLEARTATADGLAGYEQDFSFGPLKGSVRVVFSGTQAYALTAFTNALASAEERQGFFDSFRVGGKR